MPVSDDLRALADFLDEHPNLTKHLTGVYPHIRLYRSLAHEWPEVLRELGSYEKSEGLDGGYLEAIKHFGENVHLVAQIRKEFTCERRQVGEREVEREVYPDDVVPTIEKIVEPVYEWVCPDSWMRPSEQVA